jgi:hypothetical protein
MGGPNSGRYPIEEHDSNDLDLTPQPSIVFVDGRAHIEDWTPELRRAFGRLERDALLLGLKVQEVSPNGGARRHHGSHRIDLDWALANIVDAPEHVMLFDEWAKLYLAGESENPTTLAAARAKARVALSRLYAAKRIVKRYDEDGRLLLTLPPLPNPKDAWKNGGKMPFYADRLK